MTRPWRGALAGLLALAALAGVLAYNTAQLPAPDTSKTEVLLMAVDANAAAARLSRAVQIATVSSETSTDPAPLEAFARLLEVSFPKLHKVLKLERVNTHSLLYAWPGADLGAAPILLAAHFDVVPVEPGTENGWMHPPFSGAVTDGFVWGRGTMDDKASLMAQLEAVERLVDEGFQPRRTVYFAFGHDEEVGGAQGAKQIAALLASRSVHLEFTLDEGGAITEGIVPGIARPVASVMAGEKGYVSLRLSVHGEGGHSSTPPPVTHIGRIARAVERLESNPMPARLIPPVADMLLRLAPEMPLATRVAIANRWLFEPLLLRQLGAGRTTNALIRTTAAPTLFHAGFKDNVLPTDAWATVNFRLLPGDTLADVERHVRETIDDAQVSIATENAFASAPPPVSRTDTKAWAAIEKSVRAMFPQALVAGGVILATTDNRHYAAIRDHGYYFLPFLYTKDDEGRVHGTNERLAIAAYADMIRFYAILLKNTAG